MSSGRDRQARRTDPGRRLRRSLVSLAIVAIIVVALVLAVPSFQGVRDQLERANPWLVVLAAVCELLSCSSFVVAFEHVFCRTPRRVSRRVAWSELAAGAALPAGGVGGVSLGAWVLHEKGMPTERIASRSGVVFLLTSAVNVGAVALIGVGMATGLLAGPHDLALTLLPSLVALGLIGLIASAPTWAGCAAERQRGRRRRLAVALDSATSAISDTLDLLRAPDRRLLGALGFWVFDVLTLWVAFASFGHTPPPAVVAMAYLVGMLAGMLPIPGGLGAVDGGLIGALTVYGVPSAHATAAVLVYRAIALWLPALIGAGAFLLLRRNLDKPLTPQAAAR